MNYNKIFPGYESPNMKTTVETSKTCFIVCKCNRRNMDLKEVQMQQGECQGHGGPYGAVNY